MIISISAILLSLSAPNEHECPAKAIPLEEVQAQRLSGQLDQAKDYVEGRLACALPKNERVKWLLELAKIEQRIGLHQNTRPVADALKAVERAAKLAKGLGANEKGAISLARAEYFYRSEMPDRVFSAAEQEAKIALDNFEAAGDFHGQADAVHLLGLIHFQRRQNDLETELKIAREFFDQSLELDRKGGARTFFCGEYGRHVGFVHFVQGQVAEAIPHLEKSLACRLEVGATDAAIFASATLANAYTRVGEFDKSASVLLQGKLIAEELDSPFGQYRVLLSVSDLYQAQDDKEASLRALRAAYAVIRDLTAFRNTARDLCEEIERLSANC